MKYEYPLVEIIWVDAQADSGWEGIDTEYSLPPEVITVGFLIHSSDSQYVVASTYHDGQSNARMAIPSVWVKSKRELTCSTLE